MRERRVQAKQRKVKKLTLTDNFVRVNTVRRTGMSADIFPYELRQVFPNIVMKIINYKMTILHIYGNDENFVISYSPPTLSALCNRSLRTRRRARVVCFRHRLPSVPRGSFKSLFYITRSFYCTFLARPIKSWYTKLQNEQRSIIFDTCSSRKYRRNRDSRKTWSRLVRRALWKVNTSIISKTTENI